MALRDNLRALGVFGASLLCEACASDGLSEPSAFEELRLLPEDEPRCPRPPESAAAFAREIERRSDAHWARFPFAYGEGAASVRDLREAEKCYELAADRAGRLRVLAKGEQQARELSQLVKRARLNLSLALRKKASERARVEALDLLELLSLSPEEAFRDDLVALARSLSVAATESTDRSPR